MSINPSSTPPAGAAALQMQTWTTVTLILIAIGVVLVLLAILYGNRLARRRHEAEQAEEERAAAAGLDVPVEGQEPVPREPSPEPAGADTFSGEPTGADAAAPLTAIKGLGPRIAERLATLGITRIDQLAALDDGQAAALDAELGPFSGRMARDRWIAQARLLTAGDRAGYEAQFGRLG